jgi:hypothetical protein
VELKVIISAPDAPMFVMGYHESAKASDLVVSNASYYKLFGL